MAIEMKPVKGEKSRTYHFSDGSSFTIVGVTFLCVRPSGNHRVQSKDGKKFIIPPTWIALEIEADAWDF